MEARDHTARCLPQLVSIVFFEQSLTKPGTHLQLARLAGQQTLGIYLPISTYPGLGLWAY